MTFFLKQDKPRSCVMRWESLSSFMNELPIPDRDTYEHTDEQLGCLLMLCCQIKYLSPPKLKFHEYLPEALSDRLEWEKYPARDSAKVFITEVGPVSIHRKKEVWNEWYLNLEWNRSGVWYKSPNQARQVFYLYDLPESFGEDYGDGIGI